MTRRLLRSAALLVAVVAGAAGAHAQASPLSLETGDGPVYRIDIAGMIDTGLARYVERAVAEAEGAGAAAIVVDMNTYGGLLDAADDIRSALLATDVPVVVVVDHNAASAGALIALASDRIVMVPGASIGAATAVDMTGEVAPEKVQSYTRGLMRATAEATGRDPRLAEAMVDPAVEIPGVTAAGQLLTLSSQEALRVGLADAVLPSADATVEALGLDGRDAVDHHASAAERLLRFLGQPAVASLLMLMMMGGLFAEMKAPGLGLPGAVALVGAALFFAPHYLLGLVEAWEIVLFVVGVGLLAVEIFVLPGFGVFGIAGIAATIGALFLGLLPNAGFALPDGADVATALATLAAALVLLVLLAVSLARLMPESAFANRLVLAGGLSAAEGFTSADTDETLLGATGTTLTPLRPSGTALLADRRVDVVSDGPMLAAGTAVEVVSVRGSRVVVRALPEAA